MNIYIDTIGDFLNWLDSDNVIKTGEGYKTQCSQYVPTFNDKEVYTYYLKEYVYPELSGEERERLGIA